MTDRLVHAFLLASCLAFFAGWAGAEAPKKEREGGVIGTGIVGTVTELGSIIVNDQRVTFAPDTMAASVLGGQRAADLVPGDTVVVVAERLAQDWKAASIEQHFALVGPVNISGGALSVLGTTVDMSLATEDSRSRAEVLTDGDWVAVSGLWKGQTVVASRLVLAPDQSVAVLSGSYMPSATPETFEIGTTRVSGLDLAHVELGQMVTVTGRPQEGGIAAQTVRIGLFSGPMDRIIAQGYMSQPTQDGLYTILGSGAVSFTDQPQMIDTETSGLYCIEVDPTAGGPVRMTQGTSGCE